MWVSVIISAPVVSVALDAAPSFVVRELAALESVASVNVECQK